MSQRQTIQSSHSARNVKLIRMLQSGMDNMLESLNEFCQKDNLQFREQIKQLAAFSQEDIHEEIDRLERPDAFRRYLKALGVDAVHFMGTFLREVANYPYTRDGRYLRSGIRDNFRTIQELFYRTVHDTNPNTKNPLYSNVSTQSQRNWGMTGGETPDPVAVPTPGAAMDDVAKPIAPEDSISQIEPQFAPPSVDTPEPVEPIAEEDEANETTDNVENETTDATDEETDEDIGGANDDAILVDDDDASGVETDDELAGSPSAVTREDEPDDVPDVADEEDEEQELESALQRELEAMDDEPVNAVEAVLAKQLDAPDELEADETTDAENYDETPEETPDYNETYYNVDDDDEFLYEY